MSTSSLPRVIEIARDLIRIDTTNFGGGNAVGEGAAAQYVIDFLDKLGLTSTCVTHREPGEPDRPTVVARWPGVDSARSPLVVHGHLDVVPAEQTEWSVHPFAGEVRDGMLWGRGAVDMKDMVAMILATVEEMKLLGRKPRRDIILAFFADEEAGGVRGSHFVVRERPELFAGAREAISEVGGFSVRIGGRRSYLIQTGEKSLAWIRLTASGRAGHGSQVNSENAISRLAHAITALGEIDWPTELTATTAQLLHRVRELSGGTTMGERDLVAQTGFAARFIEASLQTTANPTVLAAGYKHNVIPGTATALFDVRALPGKMELALDRIRAAVGDEIEVTLDHHDVGLEAPFSGTLVSAMTDAVKRHDPGAEVLPYLLSAGTDNKALARLGIVGYGFVPLRLPDDFDFPGKFHGIDECVPLESVTFGQRVLSDLLSHY